MNLKRIFSKRVDRPIEGVIKADDAASLRLEIEEYVLTNEVEKRLESFLDAYNAKVISVVITDLNEHTYFAKIHLMYEDSEYAVDSRPSDAIAIALSVDAPIFVSDKVIEKARTIDMEKDGDQLKEWLENLNPDDFKYKA